MQMGRFTAQLVEKDNPKLSLAANHHSLVIKFGYSLIFLTTIF